MKRSSSPTSNIQKSSTEGVARSGRLTDATDGDEKGSGGGPTLDRILHTGGGLAAIIAQYLEFKAVVDLTAVACAYQASFRCLIKRVRIGTQGWAGDCFTEQHFYHGGPLEGADGMTDRALEALYRLLSSLVGVQDVWTNRRDGAHGVVEAVRTGRWGLDLDAVEFICSVEEWCPRPSICVPGICVPAKRLVLEHCDSLHHVLEAAERGGLPKVKSVVVGGGVVWSDDFIDSLVSALKGRANGVGGCAQLEALALGGVGCMALCLRDAVLRTRACDALKTLQLDFSGLLEVDYTDLSQYLGSRQAARLQALGLRISTEIGDRRPQLDPIIMAVCAEDAPRLSFLSLSCSCVVGSAAIHVWAQSVRAGRWARLQALQLEFARVKPIQALMVALADPSGCPSLRQLVFASSRADTVSSFIEGLRVASFASVDIDIEFAPDFYLNDEEAVRLCDALRTSDPAATATVRRLRLLSSYHIRRRDFYVAVEEAVRDAIGSGAFAGLDGLTLPLSGEYVRP